jgi:predicted phosphohydrolase
MNVWAIADLHLSFARPDRRERYAGRWRDHAAKIEARWRVAVQPDDLVLLPGDLSMARNHRDLQPDLVWLESLPGTKVLAPGNHDTWWNGTEKIRPMLRRSLLAVGGDAVEIAGVVVCGARGIPAPVEEAGREEGMAMAVATQEGLNELDSALESALRLRTSPSQPLYLLWHYPPFDRYGTPLPWIERFEAAAVTVCVYGHLHAQSQWSRTPQGLVGSVRYYCVAADALGFHPLRIDTWRVQQPPH